MANPFQKMNEDLENEKKAASKATKKLDKQLGKIVRR